MDCLFCNKLYFDIFDRDPDFPSSLCQLLGLDLYVFSGLLTASPTCPDCHRKAVQVKHLLQIKEMAEIQSILDRIKKEFVDDLVRSTDRGQDKGQRSSKCQLGDERMQILKGLGVGSGPKSSISSLTRLGSPLKTPFKFEEEDDIDDNIESLDVASFCEVEVTTNRSKTRKSKKSISYELIDDDDDGNPDDIDDDDDMYKVDDSRDPEFVPDEIEYTPPWHKFYKTVPSRISISTRGKPAIRDVKIILEPITLPTLENPTTTSTTTNRSSSTKSKSKSYDVNDEMIASFIERDLKNLEKYRYERQFKELFSETKKNKPCKKPRIKRIINNSTITSNNVNDNDNESTNNNVNDIMTNNNNDNVNLNESKSNGTTTSKSKRKTKGKKYKGFRGTPLPRTCEICDTTFAKPWQLTIHNRIHTGERPFACHICPKAFRCNSFLTQHLKTHGIGEGIVQCELCGVYLVNRQRVKAHYDEVHFKSVEKNYLCEYCEKKYIRESDLKVHQDKVHFGERGQFPCTHLDCDKVFSYKSSLNSHFRKEHEKVFKYFCTVPECGRGFLVKSAFNRHLNVIHQQTKPQFQCSVCPKQFYYLPILNAHLMAVHNIGEIPFKCTLCSKGFVSKYKLERHQKAVHFGDKKEKSKQPRVKKPRVRKPRVKKANEAKKVKKLKIKKDKSNYEVMP